MEKYHRSGILNRSVQVGLVGAGVLFVAGCGGQSSPTESQTTSSNSASTKASTPLLSSWFASNSGRYARVVQTTGGSLTTTWPATGLTNTGGGQSKPAYSDVQQISYSGSYVYIKGTGLASHQMGPWYQSVGKIFGNWPSNENYTRRFPVSPTVSATKTTNGLGALGLWVNGVALYNLLDGSSYSTSQGGDVSGNPMGGGGGDGIWVRNAQVVEGPTFDKSNAHQPGTGEYHYHSNPAALRFQLGDNVSGNSTSGYQEDTSKLHHSPILGWAYDGYPIYGPYGYSSPMNAGSGVRRMVSGFTIRNGKNGTTNLSTTGRHTLGKWAASLHGTSQTLASSKYGPNVNSTYTLGRYVEDFDFLGDLGFTQGKDFDLDVYNGRKCVTPEFPNGTYAYFATLDSSGNPAFPYTVGRQYYGVPSGGQVSSISESVKVFLSAGPNSAISVTVTGTAKAHKLSWTSVEGGHYKIEGSSDNKKWTTVVTDQKSAGLVTTYAPTANSTAASYAYYRVTLASLDPYDSTGNGGGHGGPP